MRFKQKIIKETQEKARELTLGLQEPLINKFTKLEELDEISRFISYNIVQLKILKKQDDFNNNNGEKNAN